MTLTPHWIPDILGKGFEAATFPLHPDEEGPAIVTLVHHTPSTDDNALPCTSAPRTFAFLAIHGWNDYFYQRELARTISSLGGHFYALDLRKYGRSHLEGQTWGYITDLSAYDEELHIALDVIFHEHGTIPIVLYGHSTGGLTATLWADRHPGVLTTLILNSPWIALQGSLATRLAGHSATDALNRLSPTATLPLPDNGLYHRSLRGHHISSDISTTSADESDPFFTTGWEPDERFRNTTSFEVRAGWLNAILNGHKRVAEGLTIDAPILVLTSQESVTANEWSARLLEADAVLTVENIWKRVPFLGRSVSLVKIPQAIHDVTLSRACARNKAFCEISRFLNAHIPTP